MTTAVRRALPGVRSKLLSVNRVAPAEKRALMLYIYPPDVQRPQTRGDCIGEGFNARRPCPFVSCRHHLAADVMPTGSLLQPFGDTDLEELPETCSLDVADDQPAGLTLVEVGYMMNLTQERTRQIEEGAVRQLHKHLQRLGVNHGMGHEDD